MINSLFSKKYGLTLGKLDKSALKGSLTVWNV